MKSRRWNDAQILYHGDSIDNADSGDSAHNGDNTEHVDICNHR